MSTVVDTVSASGNVAHCCYATGHLATLPCEMSVKYAYVTIITKQRFGKLNKTLQTNIA